MKSIVLLLLSLLEISMIPGVMSSDILIESFANPVHAWSALNDPVMGGKSESTVTIDKDQGLGIFDGQVVDVPFLKAPGFITMKTDGGVYPDLSSCQALKLTLRAAQAYSGYRISFGNVHVPGGRFAFGYKSGFTPPLEEFGDVVVPFRSFSAKWDDATGDIIETCDEEPKYCPTEKALQNLKTISIWGEGVAGDVHLEIQTIVGTQCSDDGETTVDETVPAPSHPTDVSSTNDEIVIESFDNPTLDWTTVNDPVMGGRSQSTFSIHQDDGVGVFTGEVVDVPFLKAPGFVQVVGRGPFPDISHCDAFRLTLLSPVRYDGYRLSFGQKSAPGSMPHIHGFKTRFQAPAGEDGFGDVILPFAEFSDKWDPYTGDQLVACRDDPEFCPDGATLRDLKEIAVFGEGVAGVVDLEIRSIAAVGCGEPSSKTSTEHPAASRNEGSGGRGMDGIFMCLCIAAAAAAVVLLVVRQYQRSNYDRIDNMPEIQI